MLMIKMATRGFAIAALLVPLAAGAQADGGAIVSTRWLAGHANDPKLVLVYVSHERAEYDAGHIPGSRFVSYMSVITQRGGLSTEMPDAPALRETFERAGISNDSRVVLYGPPLMASRAFSALDYLGVPNVSILDGGLAKWRKENRTLTRDEPRVAEGRLSTTAHPERVVTAEWVLPRLGKPGVALIDTRSDGEYLGSGERHGMPSEGHLAGARQLQWQDLFADPNTGLFKSRDELAKLYADRVPRGDTVVTYCFVGYRASMTYFVARALGFPARLYDGSYEDWSARHLPLVPGPKP